MSADTFGDAVPAPRRRRRWVPVLLALALFFSGAVFGGGVTLLGVLRHVRYVIHHPQEFPERATARLKHRLGLSEQQAEEVKAILKKHQANLQDVRRSVQPRVEAELDGLRRDVADVLTTEQAAKWSAFFDEKRATWLPAPPPPASQPGS